MIDLYTAPTPNGWKASVVLEELELPYIVHYVKILEGDQHKAEFKAINPNGRIPDIANWCWARTHAWSGVDVGDLPNLQRWLERLENRPGCQRGVVIPEDVNALLTAGNEGSRDAFIAGAQKMVTS